MADVSAGGSPQISGSLPFYKNPEPLSHEKHAKLGLKQVDRPLMFAREAHIAPITVGEFGPASLCYPIIFAGENRSPLAVMGLQPGANLFIDAQGALHEEAYLPAFIRRYPFVFAEDKEGGRFVVCVDTGSELVAEGGDRALFDGDQPSDVTKNAIEFLKNFEQQRALTQQLVAVLEEHDLFELREVTVPQAGADGQPGEPRKIADFYGVSQTKLNALPHDVFIGLRDNGALAAIYTHLVSLLNWDRLMQRAARSAAS